MYHYFCVKKGKLEKLYFEGLNDVSASLLCTLYPSENFGGSAVGLEKNHLG